MTIFEISIYGDIFFFENNITISQLQKVKNYIYAHYKNTKSADLASCIDIQSLITNIKKDLNIQLNLLPICTVIAV